MLHRRTHIQGQKPTSLAKSGLEKKNYQGRTASKRVKALWLYTGGRNDHKKRTGHTGGLRRKKGHIARRKETCHGGGPQNKAVLST